MNSVFLGLVIFLFTLAFFDIIVGVSNDAVNFLNSAVGAKVAKFRTILIVAGVGILLGAITSNGMMEIARHGIYRPELFTFNELMVVLVAVMVSDVILLDIFNTLGMPTSTTVSMVFELLGGSFALSILKIAQDSTGTLTLARLINTEKALSVIIAIFVSVAIAFFFGTVIQYITRLIFSFAYKKNLKWKIGIFGGIAATSIVYFMLIKSVGNFTFLGSETINFIKTETWIILLICFIFFTLLSQLLYICRVNVLKLLVLLGTFALAMAFAGNDLVNFIGVPLAGYASYTDYMANGGGDYNGYMMASLNEPAKTPILFLSIAGIIMVFALATSKKAKNVIKTSVDLARQNSGNEMFGSSRMARHLVRASANIGSAISNILPEKFKNWADTRFCTDDIENENGAAFDEIRATINLVVASLLIALGTSLKLPLSTTYVTFMVAMGTSLADRAWGRESAVFRITGVISVIGGWFITAGAAFILAFFVAMIMYFGGFTFIVLMVALAIFLIIRSNIKYKQKAEEEKGDPVFDKMLGTDDKGEAFELLSTHITRTESEFLNATNLLYQDVTDGFINEDLYKLRKVDNNIRKQRQELKNARRKEMIGLRMIDPQIAIEKGTWFHIGRNSCEDILYCIRRICDPCKEHVDNNFVPMDKTLIKEFVPLRDTVLFLIKRAQNVIETGSYKDIEDLRRQCDEFEECISTARKSQMARMQSGNDNIAVAYVYLNMLQESHELLGGLRHLLRAADHFNKTE